MPFQTEKAFCPTCKGTLLRLSHTCKMKRGASVLEGALTFVVIGSPSAWERKEDEDSTHSAKNCVVRFIQSLHREWPQASFVIGKANESLADAIDEKSASIFASWTRSCRESQTTFMPVSSLPAAGKQRKKLL